MSSMAKRARTLAAGGVETFDPVTGEGHTTPWAWRSDTGLHIGLDKSVWLYFVMPTAPFEWEGHDRQLTIGAPLDALLAELGETSPRPLGGLQRLANNREFHILSVIWDAVPKPPMEASPALAQYQKDAFAGMAVPNKCVFVGAKLRSSAYAETVAGTLRGLAERMQPDAPIDLDAYERDHRAVAGIFARNGGHRPKKSEGQVPGERDQLESWFNRGRGAEVFIEEHRTHLEIDGNHALEFAAVLGRTNGFTRPIMNAGSAWLSAAGGHEHGTIVVSIRGELEHAEVSRKRARAAQRRQKSQIEEQSRTGDIEHVEDFDLLGLSAATEAYFARGAPATLVNTSVILGRRAEPADETYIDVLRRDFGIEATPLVHRQMLALDECQPCSTKRLGRNRDFSNDMTASVIAYSGLTAFSHIGDPTGVHIGLGLPDMTRVLLDPGAASAENKPPAMAIVGEPGGGKAQPLDARILTPVGWRLMGELAVDDEVIGSDGKARAVTAIYAQGMRPIWRVTFDDGSSTECDEEHLWAVRTECDRVRHKPWSVRTTAQLRDDLIATGGRRCWEIPVVAPVEYATQETLPVRPYLLGALLGASGLAPHVSLAWAEPEIAEALREGGPTGSLRERLGDLGVRFDSSSDRSIPDRYLRASPPERIALLQGLLDSAGMPRRRSKGTDSTVELTTSSSRLADGIVELVQSLGGTASGRKVPTPHSGGGQGSGRADHRLTLRLPRWVVPFRLQRKAALYSLRPFQPVRRLAEITFVGVKAAQCIRVDAPDHLYVTDAFVVTHNTWLIQMIATQVALDTKTCIVINPKPSDSLAPFAQAVGGRVVSMSQLESAGGAFDPFGYAAPETAAEIATDHILSVLGQGWIQAQELDLSRGLTRGAHAGARCVGEALEYVTDAEVLDNISAQVEGSTLFALGVSYKPRAGFGVGGGGLTLIEFDRELGLPDAGTKQSEYNRTQRIATAALRLVTRASLEILMRAKGGTMIVDEAWTFLSHPQSLAALERLGREGRSQRVLPIFATQKLADITSRDLDSYISRVVVLQMETRKEAIAALTLCGVEASEENLAFLRTAGSVKPSEDSEGRPSMAIHKDLMGRHSAILVGPVPRWCPEVFSTNSKDRDALALKQKRQQMTASGDAA